MEKSLSFILKIREEALKNDPLGYWKVILIALNETKYVEEAKGQTSFIELKNGTQSKYSGGPTTTRLYIYALSVHHKEWLYKLYKEILEFNNYNYSFILSAKYYLEKLFSSKKIDIEQKDSTIKDNSTIETKELIQISISSYDELANLRNKNIDFSKVDFSYWKDHIGLRDPYVLSLIIEFSKKTDMAIEEWQKSYLIYIQENNNPKHLIPSIYTLISEKWIIF